MVCAVGKSRGFGLTAYQPDRRSIGGIAMNAKCVGDGFESKCRDPRNLSDPIDALPEGVAGSDRGQAQRR
jgi:hypothetical protein